MNRRTPFPVPRRFPAFVVICALIFVAVYGIVVYLYAQSGRSDAGTSIDNSRPGLHVVLTPREVDAAGDRIRFDMHFGAGSEPVVSSDGHTVVDDFRMLLSGADDTEGQVTDFAKGKTVAPTSVQLRTGGTIERWPFDTHPSNTLVLVTTGVDANQDAIAVPADISLGPHHVPGWDITIRPDQNAAALETENGVIVQQYVIEARRATATVAFGIVLIALMVIMPALGLTVAVLVLRGRRKVEIGFLTWNAGMLFATPTLRNFLPGQPPVGSWVDYLVVLWVIAGLILALLISVVAWYRWSTPQPQIEAARRARAVAKGDREKSSDRTS